MNFMGNIRRLRSLPRMLLAMVALTVAQTTLLPCAMADGPPVSAMSEHCAHCPPDTATSAISSDCALPEAVNVDLLAVSAYHASLVDLGPLLQPMPFDLRRLRLAQARLLPAFDHFPPPIRPLHLTHCVQLK